MQRLLMPAILACMVQMPVMADTLITAENLNKLEVLLPQLSKLEQSYRGDINKELDLQPHCDWDKHYSQLKSQQKDTGYVAKAEKLIVDNGFKPAQFVELSAKVAWPMLDAAMPMMQMSKQALAYLPAAQRKSAEVSLAKSTQYHTALGQCLTADDKAAITQYKDRIMQLAGSMAGSNPQGDMQKMMKMGKGH